MGQVYHRICPCCGHERRYVAVDKMAENRATMSESAMQKLAVLTRDQKGALVDAVRRSNGGCVVYVEERS